MLQLCHRGSGSRALVSGSVQNGSEQWFQSFLSQLRSGESLSLRVAFVRDGGGLSLGATASCTAASHRGADRASLSKRCERWSRTATPYFKLAADQGATRSSDPTLQGRPAAPAGQRICLDDLVCRTPRPVATPRAPTVLRSSPTRTALGALAGAASRSGCRRRAHEPTGIARSRVGSRTCPPFVSMLTIKRALQELLKGLVIHASRAGSHDASR